MEGCIAEWQQHCLLGVHPHPANPKKVEAALSTAIHTIPGPTRNRGRRVEPGLQAQMCAAILLLLVTESDLQQEGILHARPLSPVPGRKCDTTQQPRQHFLNNLEHVQHYSDDMG
jgi:hypothetical protein